jgi:hypothetical protein
MSDEQILADIERLQTIEKELFANLETTPALTVDQQNKIIDRINSISEMRIDLYQTIGGMNQFYKTSLENSEDTLNEQKVAIGIIEKELNDSKQKIDELKNAKIGKLRAIELNSYYSDAYEEKTQLMKVLFYTLLPIVVISFLYKKGILPGFVFNSLVLLIVFIGAFYSLQYLTSIFMRDNMNYQEYDWFFNKNNAPKANPSDGSETDPWALGSAGLCVSDSCCNEAEGLVYDSATNRCIKKQVEDVLTKGVSANAKPDATISESFV